MIKQIQLRGISRTPSDRLTEDGGLSESLNMYLDTAESAPAFIPQDVTSKLGLPNDLQAERIFIHKTAYYKNYIVVQDGNIFSFDIGKKLVLELKENEEVKDISSLGNTLIVSTSLNLHYLLYKQRQYTYLGTKVPFPHITFGLRPVDEPMVDTYKLQFGIDLESGTANQIKDALFGKFKLKYDEFSQAYLPFSEEEDAGLIPPENQWEEENFKESKFDTFRENVIPFIETHIENMRKKGHIVGNFVIRYAVTLFDDFKYSSFPILIKSPLPPIELSARARLLGSGSSPTGYVYYQLFQNAYISSDNCAFDLVAQCDNIDILQDWVDIIKDISFYISPLEIDYWKKSFTLHNREYIINREDDYAKDIHTTASIYYGEVENQESTILEQTSLSYLVCSIPMVTSYSGDRKGKVLSKGIKEMQEGKVIDLGEFYSPDLIYQQDPLVDDDMKHYDIESEGVATYNGRIILSQPSERIDYDYGDLNSIAPREWDYPRGTVVQEKYSVTYVLSGTREDKVVKKIFEYNYPIETAKDIYAFQVFPDVRCYKMLVALEETITNGAEVTTNKYYGEFDMAPHPYLDCSYYYGGVNATLKSLCVKNNIQELSENNRDEAENKLYISYLDDPFVFPISGRYTFQSKVVGVAIATTTLSQGQFGQFPLYVFTEDGIWAMETASDGSFISQKPLSREVCTNPDSITSIDNAVVFVTDKGLMMIQGSQVINISPFMNGRHYIPNDSATNIIAKQEGFSEFENVIKDETPFVAFMKKAKIAYDYAGQRLICIAGGEKKEDFQYVYKIDTQTWHKVAFKDFDLLTPLNSYPDCLVQGETTLENPIKMYWIIDPIESPSASQIQTAMQTFEAETGIELSVSEARFYLKGEAGINVNEVNDTDIITLGDALSYSAMDGIVRYQTATKIYSLGTVLDVDPESKDAPDVAKGILITRPFDLGMPDVFKSITSIKIRGDFDKGNVKFILQGSDDGRTFYTMNSLRGKSWKMFRIFILADLEPTERISWIDIDFEPRYNNRLR